MASRLYIKGRFTPPRFESDSVGCGKVTCEILFFDRMSPITNDYTRVARRLGISRQTLITKIQAYGIN